MTVEEKRLFEFMDREIQALKRNLEKIEKAFQVLYKDRFIKDLPEEKKEVEVGTISIV